jgi:tetratricopeptide (TPR) repeat protein
LSRTLAHIAIAAIIAIPLSSGYSVAGPPGSQTAPKPPGNAIDDEPDDRLSPEDERLTRSLTDRGMPELVDELLSSHPPAHRVYIARAYAYAAVKEERDAATRERFFRTAQHEYRRALALEKDRAWLRGLRRRFNIVQWRIELADMILRHWIAPDLDRYEITSGLDYDRGRLTKFLREASALYRADETRLDEFLVGLRTEEERYLLLGLGDEVVKLREHRRLNCAWADLYLAMAGDTDAAERKQLLEGALGAFDTISRSTKAAAAKYNALLGAGIALRESDRGSEAESAFDRVLESTANAAVAARAKYEKARLLLKQDRFDDARREIDALAGISTDKLGADEQGAVFYIRLAPLIHAYSFALEAKSGRGGPVRKEKAQQQAVAALNRIAEQGGIWPEIVRAYLDMLAGTKRNLPELTSTELHLAAARLMTEKDYAQAIEAWRALLARSEAKALHAEARFNLGVCLFQTQDLRAAAEAFVQVAREEDRGELLEKSAEYAYRCWRQIAQTSRTGEDYRRLAEAAELLTKKAPGNEMADEAAWVAALARQEAGEFDSAAAAYAAIPPASPHYWEARRNAVRCRQRQYESLPGDASSRRRGQLAQGAASAWLKLAEDLQAAVAADPRVGRPADPNDNGGGELPGVGGKKERGQWIADARLAAATIYSADDVRMYQEGLAVLKDAPLTGRVVALRIQCHRGLGDRETARRVLDEYLAQASGSDIGPALIGLAAEMETDIERLRESGRHDEAARLAESSLPTISQLLEWIQGQPEHKQHVPVVRYSLAKALIQARHGDEAKSLLDQLMADDPANGSYVRSAALLYEDLAPAAGADRDAVLDKAEALWSRLLADQTLRQRAPAEYWAARYYWLRHQLRHGRAEEVAKGIDTERAFFPDLGGPPWQTRLRELAEQARAAPLEGKPKP